MEYQVTYKSFKFIFIYILIWKFTRIIKRSRFSSQVHLTEILSSNTLINESGVNVNVKLEL